MIFLILTMLSNENIFWLSSSHTKKIWVKNTFCAKCGSKDWPLMDWNKIYKEIRQCLIWILILASCYDGNNCTNLSDSSFFSLYKVLSLTCKSPLKLYKLSAIVFINIFPYLRKTLKLNCGERMYRTESCLECVS